MRRESLLARGEWMPVPWQLVVLYGLGPALFRHGLVFSLGLTLFPAVIVTFFAIGGLLFR